MKKGLFKFVSLLLIIIICSGCLKEEFVINLNNVSTHEYFDLYVDVPDDLKISLDDGKDSTTLSYNLNYNDSYCSLDLNTVIVEEVVPDHLREGIEYYLQHYMADLEGISAEVQFIDVNGYEWGVSSLEFDDHNTIYYCAYYNGRSYTIVYKYDKKTSSELDNWEEINKTVFGSLKFKYL